jgi:hypothetical protein
MLEETFRVRYRVLEHVLLGTRVPGMLLDGESVLHELGLCWEALIAKSGRF